MNIVPAGSTERVIWGIIILVILGYLAGSSLNRRRSRAIGEWLQRGLDRLGKQASWKWLRAMNSGGEVTVPDASRPFRHVVISYYLLTREFAPLWAWERLKGKRDLLAIRAIMRYDLSEEIEVVPIEGKLRALVDQSAGARPWQWQEGPAGLGLGIPPGGGSRLRSSLRPFLEKYGSYVQRLSLRRRQPNLMLFLQLEGLEQKSSAELLAGLREALMPAMLVGAPEATASRSSEVS